MPPLHIKFFEFWEIYRIGLNITRGNHEEPIFTFDLTLKEAKKVLQELTQAIKDFELEDKSYNEYVARCKESEPDSDGATYADLAKEYDYHGEE